MAWTHSNRVCMTVRYHKKSGKVDRYTVFSDFQWVCLHKFWKLSTSKHTKWLKQESWFENQKTSSHISHFSFTLVAIRIKLKDELMCPTESPNLNAKWCRECMQEGGWKLSNPISIRWLGHPNPNSLLLHSRSIPCLDTLVGSGRYLITLLKCRLFHYIVELYPTFLHCWAIPNPFTSLRYNLA